MSAFPPDSAIPSATSKPKSRARYLWIVGIALYAAAVWFFGWNKVVATITGMNLRLLLATIALETVTIWVRAFKWRYALGPQTDPVWIFFLSKATGSWTPGRVGELTPLLIPKYRNSRVAAWIITDRLLEGVATILIGLCGLSFLRISKFQLLLLMLGALAALAVLPAYALTRQEWLAALAARFKHRHFLSRVFAVLQSVSAEIHLLRAKLLVATTLTFVTTCFDILGGMLLWRAVGVPLSFALLATVQCVFGIVSVIPVTPTASGVPYVAAGVLLHEVAAVPPETYTAMVALHFTVLLAVLWASFGLAAATLARKHAA